MGEPELTKSEKLSLAGKKGYLKTLEKYPDFHRLGGMAYAEKIDSFFCSCHGTGLAAALAHGKVGRKQHRYRQPVENEEGEQS